MFRMERGLHTTQGLWEENLMRLATPLFLLLTIGLATSTASAVPIVTNYDSDADFLANADFVKSFGGNVRWGNGGASGDWEYSVVDASDIPVGPGNPRQNAWLPGPSTNDHAVTFSFDGVDAVTLDPSLAAGASTASGFPGTGLNALAIRARANDGDAANLVGGITITFSSGAPILLGDLIGDQNAEYIVITDARIADGFTLTSTGQLTDGRGSSSQYGFKVGIIPEPSTALLVGAGLALLASRRR